MSPPPKYATGTNNYETVMTVAILVMSIGDKVGTVYLLMIYT